MPVDLAMTWNAKEEGFALSFENNDMETTESLLPSVLISLFTDARAEDDEALPDPQSNDRRGWWADSTNTASPTDSLGSKLWLLEREKNINVVLKKAKTYIEAALAWMVTEGIAQSVTVETEAQISGDSGTIILAYSISIKRPNNAPETFKFEREWEASV